MRAPIRCTDCDTSTISPINRRRFVQVLGASAAASVCGVTTAADAQPGHTSENLVQGLYESLSERQKKIICFDWDHTDERGLLRLHVSNNWSITEVSVSSEFFTRDQQEMIEAIFWGLYNPEWKDRIRRQLQDDAGGYGRAQSIAIFGTPGSGKFEFVMTGRHLTVRCDGDSTEHAAFGGPIFYGHAAGGFDEAPDHPGNVFWPQAVKANKLYEMLDGRQRKPALVANAPAEEEVHFQGPAGRFPGLPLSELSDDQREHLQGVLSTLLEPYRAADSDEARRCLDAGGGLDSCSIAFYESDDIGGDGIWDTWRLEGPSFVWHFRGDPHVHVWVNVADDASLKITT